MGGGARRPPEKENGFFLPAAREKQASLGTRLRLPGSKFWAYS